MTLKSVEKAAPVKRRPVNLTPPPESGVIRQEPAIAPVRCGQIIAGKYEVERLIGRGAMGFVVAARHLELGEQVALKFLIPEALDNPEIVARFAREARASARIKSEYIARVLDVGNLPNGLPYIVMEHLEGDDLANILQTHGALVLPRAVEYVMQACEALAAAHSVGIVHRDIKPENLFVVQHAPGIGSIKVLDFGVSKMSLTGSPFENDLPLVQTVLPVGSPMYMSPEQIRGEDVDARTDIWSLGCVLYELLTANMPFDAPSITQLTAGILEKEPTPLASYFPGVPAEVEAIIARCLQKNADDRFQSVAELALALFPFAPSRARLNAERCASLLKVTGVLPAHFELQSRPFSARPLHAVPAQYPLAETQLESIAKPSRRTAGLRLTSRWISIACVGFGILAFASGFVFSSAFSRADSIQVSAPTPATPAVVRPKIAPAPATRAAPTAEARQLVMAQQAPPERERTRPAAPGAKPPTPRAAPSPPVRRAEVTSALRSSPRVRSPRARNDEIDVGF
jgi:serine/threonine-protein kinase